MRAAILAGGSSRRFGKNKLLYMVNGKPLLAYTINNLMSAKNVDSVYLIVRKTQVKKFKRFGIPLLVDDYAVGPLGGILVALRNLGNVLVAPGDMPLVPSELFDNLINKFLETKCEMAVLVYNGETEIFPMVISSHLENAIEASVKIGDLSVKRFLNKVEICFVDIGKKFGKDVFLNINTEKESAKFKSIIERLS